MQHFAGSDSFSAGVFKKIGGSWSLRLLLGTLNKSRNLPLKTSQRNIMLQPGLLGNLHPGNKKLEGKTFYLDNVKKRPAALLLEAISLLGGSVESFLHRDVSFVVTGSQQASEEKKLTGCKRGSDEPRRPVKQQESVLEGGERRPPTPRPVACGSRGKALLEKAIRNNRVQASSVLTNARTWGVHIVHVDDVLIYLKKLNSERVEKSSRAERTSTKQSSCHVVKAKPLRLPYLKIEDVSRRYKPLNMQSMSFPSLYYLGRFSPFESPPPPRFEKTAQGDHPSRPKSKVESGSKGKSRTLSPWPPRKKSISYCECCLRAFTNLPEHLESDQHRAFATKTSNYDVLEQLVCKMLPAFDLHPSEQAEDVPNRPPNALPIPANCELELLTDAELEHEIQALKGQSSFPAPAQNSLLQLVKSPEELDPVQIPATTSTDLPCPEPDDLTHAATVPLAVLDMAPQVHFPPARSLCPATEDLSIDPYSMPPVLSPQVFSAEDTETRSLYSEPPVLSPQNSDGDYQCEMETTLSVSESFPVSFPLFPSVPVSNTEEAKETPCPFKQSHPAIPNPRKRRRHSSCDRDCRKRKRMEEKDISRSEGHVVMQAELCFSARTTLQGVQSNAGALMCPPAGDRQFSPFKLLGHSVEVRWSPAPKILSRFSSQDFQQSPSVCIDPALIPDVACLSPASSDSDWDRELLTGLGSVQTGSPSGPSDAAAAGEPDTDFIHRPCVWMSDSSYESRLHSALRPATLVGEPSTFSRTLVQIVEVLH
ncbi:uncharacterized protein dbf4b isoform X2 [Syngnathus typhle]|uniref:uncharacterized protein dbf4b isoform X2 n=1 Tax=Syngnathus typhle TaxID=161592 RepID=UPI002A69CD73|nr:uncharacterized protein dbf4b isoform X2 [Syngnathus typhle]